MEADHLPYDLWRTIQDVIESPAAGNVKDFKLYVTGYAKVRSVPRHSSNEETRIIDYALLVLEDG